MKKAAQIRGARDINDINDFDPNGGLLADPKPPEIRGPYGPPWPLVTEPMELEIGSAQVKIEVEDENAKYPLGWAMIADEKLKPVAGAGWSTFCEWMGYLPQEIGLLNEDLGKIGKAKPFKIEFKQETENVEPPANVRNKITRPTVRRCRHGGPPHRVAQARHGRGADRPAEQGICQASAQLPDQQGPAFASEY